MIIKDQGIVITGVPGIEYINVAPADHEGGAGIAVKFQYFDNPIGFGVDEMEELIEALTHAWQKADKIRQEQRWTSAGKDLES